MNLSTDRLPQAVVVRVNEARVMYPLLAEFADTISGLFRAGDRQVVLELTTVTYIDSATVGCLMDLYRQATAAGGTLKLAGVQKRVETMLTMTGAQNFLEIHPDEASALKSFGAPR
jgi:stage II sporulation protein AA (anti-sigma F factor antagonist)